MKITSVMTIDLDWVNKYPQNGGPANGRDMLAEALDEGGELAAVWWDGDPGVMGTRALVIYREAQDMKPGAWRMVPGQREEVLALERIRRAQEIAFLFGVVAGLACACAFVLWRCL